MAEKST